MLEIGQILEYALHHIVAFFAWSGLQAGNLLHEGGAQAAGEDADHTLRYFAAIGEQVAENLLLETQKMRIGGGYR